MASLLPFPKLFIRRTMENSRTPYIGTAGWTIPRAYAAQTAAPGSHLERYAALLSCVEINSTFYRLPRASTIARWTATSPDRFRFAVKLSKAATHEKKLNRCGPELAAFFAALEPMEGKLGPVLVQLPPKLAFDEGTAHDFFTTLRELHSGTVVLEPRHPSWFTAPVDQILRGFEIARAVADPPTGSATASKPGGWLGLRYYRLHGSPRTYWSDYGEDFLEQLAEEIRTHSAQTWVVFDNTAQGHAFGNALTMAKLLSR